MDSRLRRTIVGTVGLVAVGFAVNRGFAGGPMSPAGAEAATVTMIETDTSKIQTIVLAGGATLPGPIPYVFIARMNYVNNSDMTVQFAVDDGLVFVEQSNPLNYQFVTVIKGFADDVLPHSSLDKPKNLYLMCIERGVAAPPIGHVLVPLAQLPGTIVDEMRRYRDTKDAALQAQTRDHVIGQINDAVLGFLQSKRLQMQH